MSAPQKVLELVDLFHRNADAYHAPQYNEAMVRQEFINPLFKCLGWDMDNEQGYAEAYKDVIHEAAIKIGGATKAPDYCFRIGGAAKFFLEAKRPSVRIKDDPDPAYQLRRYAWTGKLPLSILTGFEEFAVYDCRIKPAHTDRAGVARIRYLRYEEYADRWDEVAEVFSREAILKGSFDKFAESNKAKRGTAAVDTAFLQEIESWREMLARNLALRNPHLSQRELNFAVQVTIDRIIFLRMCEDRGIEPYGQLQKKLMQGPDIYQGLLVLYRKADDRYNSGLFHFHAEKGRPEAPDTLTPSLTLDDKPLKDILRGLYYPECPYEFSVLSGEILGQVYEQFLGKVIRLTAGHQAKVEDKPEVRKAGGVYYTPTYIVDYIVRQTVGKLLGEPAASAAGLTPKQAAKLRILDPACGSGSFLLGAYQLLLDWHRDRYLEDGPKKHTKELYQGAGGVWRLTTAEKKRILLANIYGVDIDPQAVEVTKLSLLLKVLEGESEQTLQSQLQLFHERALPDLSSNIQCGNSLIGPDFYEGQQMTMFDEEELYRINVFDWNAAFPWMREAGGFDVVIGNPPYIRIQTMKEWAPMEVEYYKKAYTTASQGNYDIYVVFVERGLSLLNGNGRLGFIMPQKFSHVSFGEALRAFLANGEHVEHMVSFANNQVFAAAFVNTCILVLSKQPCHTFEYVEVLKVQKGGSLAKALSKATASTLPSRWVTEAPWVLKPASTMALLEKLAKQGQRLEECTSRIFQGLKTSADKIYVLELIREEGDSFIGYSAQLGEEIEVERHLFHTLIKGTEMRRFAPLPARRIVLFPYVNDGSSVRLIEEKQLREMFPKTYAYLKANEKYLRGRENGRMNHSAWYAYIYPKALDVISVPKLITPDLAPRSSFLIDRTGEYFFLGGAAGGYGILPKADINPLYLLGLLNSRVLSFFITCAGQQMESGYFSFEARFIRSTPIRVMDVSSTTDKFRHDQLVHLIEQMLSLHQQLAAARTSQEQTVLQRHIDATDRQIDELVYELYGLTEEEIRIVEKNA